MLSFKQFIIQVSSLNLHSYTNSIVASCILATPIVVVFIRYCILVKRL